MVEGYAVSPNQKMFAYSIKTEQQENIIIINSDGQIVVNIPVINSQGEFLFNNLTPGVSDWWIGEWLDNENIVIDVILETMPKTNEDRPYSLLILNPFTLDGRQILPEYPDIDYQNRTMPLSNWNGYPEMVMDPTGTRLVYGTVDSGVILWDLEQAKIIVRYPEGSISAGPEWKEDGSEFVIELRGVDEKNRNKTHELYRVLRDGTTTQITHLGSQYEKVDFPSYFWSPEGNRIAFTVMLEDDPCGKKYALHPGFIDMDDMGRVTIFCGNVSQNIIWFPYGNQLLLEASPMSFLGDSIVLDLEKRYMTQILENSIPLAWMAATTPEP